MHLKQLDLLLNFTFLPGLLKQQLIQEQHAIIAMPSQMSAEIITGNRRAVVILQLIAAPIIWLFRQTALWFMAVDCHPTLTKTSGFKSYIKDEFIFGPGITKSTIVPGPAFG